LNPAKISGNCGRLLCCLRYESGYYRETARHFPRVGTEWLTPQGAGTVDVIQVLRERMLVQMPDGNRQEVPLTDIKRGREKKKSWFE
jgi:cell fate regulator YaaT (PSP1 superfamily)